MIIIIHSTQSHNISLNFWKKSLEKFHNFFVQIFDFQYQGNDSLILQQFLN